MDRSKFLAFAAFCSMALPVVTHAAALNEVTFDLVVNPKFEKCMAINAWTKPSARVTVTRTENNDILLMELKNVKPNLAFDAFTVQNSPFLSTGAADPKFTGSFGLAWYQTDVKANSTGGGETVIKTILLDQIFGFDATTGLNPTNTFHLGFWFNNPHDAAACGFDVTKPTPFNGEHKAGPLAMISTPDAHTTLGPLCTEASGTPAKCHP